MADFDPFANQGGPVAWDPEHSTDAKKQAEVLRSRLAADSAESGNGRSAFDADDSTFEKTTFEKTTFDEAVDPHDYTAETGDGV
ncbi:MAG: hypothetical protein ABIW32_04870 [Terrimesophilobacter sp.]